jgi:hypothetical protein
MSKRSWIAALLLSVLFVGLLAYGIYTGDAAYLLENAATICYT